MKILKWIINAYIINPLFIIIILPFSLFKKKSRKERVLEKCGCVCYCPSCGDILNDQARCEDTDLVRYTCSCGIKSEWNFDIWAVPVLVDDGKKQVLGIIKDVIERDKNERNR